MRLAYIRKPEDSKRGNADHSSPSPSQSKVQKTKRPAIPFEDTTNRTGEDQNSMQRLLSSELKKVVPDKIKCQEVMTRTFVVRRQEIKAGNLSTIYTYTCIILL